MTGRRMGRSPRAGAPASAAGRRIVASLGVAVVVAAALLGIRRLDLDTRPSSFLPRDAVAAGWTDVQRSFGGDPLVVLLEARADSPLLRPTSLASLVELEGRLAALPDVAVVYGPGTVLNQVVGRVQDLLLELTGRRDGLRARAEAEARAAGRSDEEVRAAGERAVERFDLRYGPMLVEALPAGLPTLRNAAFVRAVALTDDGKVRSGLRWVVPDARHAAIYVRPRENLTQDDLRRLVDEVSARVRESGLDVDATITGAPALASALGDEIRAEVPRLAALSLVAVATVFAAFGSGKRLARFVPLGAGLAGAGTVLAVLGWLGMSLSIGALAFLPVVLGIGTDFPLHATGTTRRSVVVAAAATAAGFASMVLTPLPFVRQLGLVLAAGVLAATGIGLLAARGSADAVPAPRASPIPGGPRPWTRRATAGAVLAVGFAGWALLPALPVEARPERLAAGLPAIEDAREAERVLGATGEIAVRLTGDGEPDAETLRWFARSEEILVTRFGDRLRPILTPHRLLGFLGSHPTDAQVEAVTQLVPGYLLRAVANPVSKEVVATYGLQLGDLASQRELLAEARAALPPAPHGRAARIDGLPVVASHALDLLEGSRLWPNVCGVVAFGLIVLVGLRDTRLALLASAVATASTGWGTLLLWSTGRAVSPFALSIGSLSVAAGGELTLVLHDRLRRGVPSPWRPVLVAAATSIAGFGALAFSSLGLLRELAMVLVGAVVVGGAVGGALVWATTSPTTVAPRTVQFRLRPAPVT